MKKANKKATPPSPSRYAYDGLDRVIHERARLGMLTCLITNPKGLPFPQMKKLCALTDGNLNRHLQVLQDALLVSLAKGPDRDRPQTYYRITALGRKRYVEYLAVLEQVVMDGATAMRGAATPEKST
jgi:DNA-binding transcriptional ArsR family regulator